ncbi:MAG: hypothetical protein J0M24_18240 [Verrucomicrobia bacterium]|nr:hypothetical protein [Verrucomicrobiota bacterium]
MTRLPDSTDDPQASSELLLLPDGRILAHHLTPELALVLRPITDSSDATLPSVESPVPNPS